MKDFEKKSPEDVKSEKSRGFQMRAPWLHPGLSAYHSLGVRPQEDGMWDYVLVLLVALQGWFVPWPGEAPRQCGAETAFSREVTLSVGFSAADGSRG